uniref:Uncharacterized protein n=1 Tax=Anguilla anguilla TaxID=7936 RepID=A0A0E9TL08_ANGAN
MKISEIMRYWFMQICDVCNGMNRKWSLSQSHHLSLF